MTKKMTHSSRCIASVLKQKMKLLVVGAALVSGGLQAQTVETLTTASTSPWAPPAGVGVAKVECWAGGGAGGSMQNTTTTYIKAGGGAGGSYAASTLTGLSASYQFSVGAKGVAPTSLTASDHNTVLSTQNGGDTNFGNGTIIALGGPGGKNAYLTTITSAGAGGVAPTTGNIGTTIWYGGNGGNTGSGSGGGGGSAGSTGNGGNGAGAGSVTAGAAGSGGGAAGGAAVGANNGNVGGSPGGGGSGGGVNTQTSQYKIGGSGGDGQIKITYYSTPTQAADITFSSVGSNQMTISWTNGGGANRLVVVKAESAVNDVPVDGTNYTAEAVFGSGTQIGTGNYVVFNGTESTVTVTGLTPELTYHVAVFENNGATTTLINYNTDSAPTASQATGSTTGLSAVNINAFITVDGKSLLLNGEVNTVEVYNAQGKLIQSQNKVTRVNVNNNGIYIVKMYTPQGVTVQKVSIK